MYLAHCNPITCPDIEADAAPSQPVLGGQSAADVADTTNIAHVVRTSTSIARSILVKSFSRGPACTFTQDGQTHRRGSPIGSSSAGYDIKKWKPPRSRVATSTVDVTTTSPPPLLPPPLLPLPPPSVAIKVPGQLPTLMNRAMRALWSEGELVVSQFPTRGAWESCSRRRVVVQHLCGWQSQNWTNSRYLSSRKMCTTSRERLSPQFHTQHRARPRRMSAFFEAVQGYLSTTLCVAAQK